VTATLPTSKDFARTIRADTVRMIFKAKASHVGSSLSMTDILAVLFTGIMRHDPKAPKMPDRDRLVISKGHAAAALYATLAGRGYFPADWLDHYCAPNYPLFGHVSHQVPGVEVSTGSLGHGLPIACGMAIAGQKAPVPFRVFTILSDGECDEGSVWEAALFAPFHKLSNLTAIIDYNKIQSFGRVEDVLNLEPFADKWRSFGWDVREIDGHDHDKLRGSLTPQGRDGKPVVVIAHTVKGKGVSFMENKLAWHYSSPSAEQMAAALAEIEASRA
jgi:transketolase